MIQRCVCTVLNLLFLAHRIKISACVTLTDMFISPVLSHPGPDQNYVDFIDCCIGSHVSTSSSDVDF